MLIIKKKLPVFFLFKELKKSFPTRQMRPPEVAQEMERREALARAALKMDGGGGEETNGDV